MTAAITPKRKTISRHIMLSKSVIAMLFSSYTDFKNYRIKQVQKYIKKYILTVYLALFT